MTPQLCVHTYGDARIRQHLPEAARGTSVDGGLAAGRRHAAAACPREERRERPLLPEETPAAEQTSVRGCNKRLARVAIAQSSTYRQKLCSTHLSKADWWEMAKLGRG